MPCRRRDRRRAAAAAAGAALAAAGRGLLASAAAFAGPAARPAQVVRGAHLRAAATSSGRESRAPAAKHGSPSSTGRQSGVPHICWDKHNKAWRVQFNIKNGLDKGRIKVRFFRPKVESPEEVERARLNAIEELQRFEEEDQLGRARASSRAERQSGVMHINWAKERQAWRVNYRMTSGPKKGAMKRPTFRPKDESLEEVEKARLAAVEALQRLQEEDRALGPSSSGGPRADTRSVEHQSGVKHIYWHKTKKAWRVSYMMRNGLDTGCRKEANFRPKDESPEEVEQARLAAVEALQRLQEEDSAVGPSSSGERDASHASAERRSGVKYIGWVSERQAWRVTYKKKNGPDKGRRKQANFRPQDESPEEVERARLAAVEALRRLEEEDGAFGPSSSGERHASPGSVERQSGVKHISWDKTNQAWRVQYRVKNSQDKCTKKQPSFRPKDESPEEVERARLAAVEALRRFQEEDRALGLSSSGGPYAARDREEASAESAEEGKLSAFRERYPVDDSAFHLLAKQPVAVQSMVISNFCPPEEGLSDHSTLLAKAVQTITKAARRPRQVATFSTGCFWESQRLFDRVRGIVNTTVGYTGGHTKKKPTYESVQLGDGHSEAIRIEFDPELITYDALLTHFDSVRERTPAGLAFAEGAQSHTTTRQSGTTTQYHSAVWYHDEEQKRLAQARLRQGAPAVHLARMESWHDAEKHHQKYYQKGCSVQ